MTEEPIKTASIVELPESQPPVFGFEIIGKVTVEEERAWVARFEAALKEYPRVDVLVVLGPDAGWGLEAGWEDIKWMTRNRAQIGRIAIVSDSTVWAALVAIDRPFAEMSGVEECHFQRDEMDAAWSWLRR